MKPLVSILIPAYNSEQWISETLQSAVGQDWGRTEIIVVDDGSTDGTLAMARRFESPQVCVVSQRNQGASASRNHALSLAQGDYIQYLDADDLLAPDKISQQMKFAEDPRMLLSGAFAAFLYRAHRAEFRPTALWCDLAPTEWLIRKMAHNLYMQTSTWLVSRTLTEAVGLWDTNLLTDDDGEYFCRVLIASNGTRFVGDSKVYYRASGSASLSYMGNSDRKMEAQWLSMQAHVGCLRSLEDSERSRAACVAYLQNWSVAFHPQRPDLMSQVRDLAMSLGGELALPRMSWKYAWLNTLFGWRLARKAQLALPAARLSGRQMVDKTLFRLEKIGNVERVRS